ncbi:unnamed protein product [Prorocentrum cordatum]|uniref:Uncharacterized protein n=1 Tax=Prorocentrum cordatum TaxID=2364126 RepID=A0ABN9SYH3_9DINO|nr:unnamed protein product [Polarella glacialis]
MPGRAAGVWRRKGGWAGGRREKDSDQPLGASYPRAPALWWCSYHRRSWCFLDLSAQAAQAAQEDLEEENREGREQGGSSQHTGESRSIPIGHLEEEGAEEQRDGRGGTDAAPTIETMAGSRCGDPLPRGPLARSGLRCHRGGRWSQRSPPQRPPRAAG